MFKNLTASAQALLFANIIALLGMWIFQWSLFSIMLAYWLENVIIGFYTILKIVRAESPNPSSAKFNGRPIKGSGKAVLIPFFIMHFGIFTLVHGVFVVGIFGFASIDTWNTATEQNLPDFFQSVAISLIGFLVMAVALVVSHGISFRSNYIGKEEYKKVSPIVMMFAPYGRVVVMHIVLLGSGFVLGLAGFNIFTASVIVIAKITLDFILHRREHFKLGKLSIIPNHPVVNST